MSITFSISFSWMSQTFPVLEDVHSLSLFLTHWIRNREVSVWHPPKKIRAKENSHINRNSAVLHSSIYAKLGRSMIKFVFSDSACSNKHSIRQFLFWIEESWDCIPILVHNIAHKWNWVSIFPMAYINFLSNKSLHLEFPPHFLPEKVCTVQRKFTINFAYISVGLHCTSRFGSNSTQKYTDGL